MARLQDIQPQIERARVVEAARALGLDPHRVKELAMNAQAVIVTEWTETDENGDGVVHYDGSARLKETYYRVVD